jgi:hypothetical protein
MFIADFDEIPQNSREKVLKAYYNGIFNGDAEGRFNPNNNLTRAEMAKVLATIKDFSLRTRLITEGYGEAVEKNMLHTDFDGVKTVKFGTWKKLLEEQAKNVTATTMISIDVNHKIIFFLTDIRKNHSFFKGFLG